MPNNSPSNALQTLASNAVDGVVPKKNDEVEMEELTLLVCTNRVRTLEQNTKKELKELEKRQGQVRFLHLFLKTGNALTDTDGNLDFSKNNDLQSMLPTIKEMGVNIDTKKTTYSKEEKERLIENVRMTCEDLTVQNEMQLQTISRLTNERYEMYQMARSILKPLHEDKINKARSIAGK